MPHVSQSSLLAFYLLAAFIVFITVRGELSTYVGFFIGGAGAVTTTPTSTASTAAPTDQLSAAQNLLLTGAQLAIIG